MKWTYQNQQLTVDVNYKIHEQIIINIHAIAGNNVQAVLTSVQLQAKAEPFSSLHSVQ